MLVRDLMTHDIVTIETTATVTEAARLMREHNVGSLIALADGGTCAGLLTDRQIVVETIGADRDPKEIQIADVMTPSPVCVHEEDTIFDAATRVAAEGPFRRMPVVDDDDRVVGVLSIADLALAAHPLIEAILCETEASVREVEVDESGMKTDLQDTLPTPAQPPR